MKTQFKRFSKSTISVLLAVCLLFSCMTVGLIATSAAQDDSEPVGGWSWEATFKMGSNVSGGWDGSGQSATHTSGNRYVYYDFYFTHDDTTSDGEEVRFAYWQDGDWDSRIVPTTDKTSIDSSNNKKNCTYGNSNSRENWYWVYKPSWLDDDDKYYKVTMTLDMQDNNYDGKMWYTATALTSFSPTLSVPSTGTVGTAITLTGGSTDTGAVGTLTKKYQYSTDNGSTWTDLSNGSYTATSAGTVKFRYKVADGGITSSKAYALSDRIEYSEVKSCTFSAAATTYTSISAAAKGSNDGSTYSTTLSGTPATISASSYTTGTSALTITAAAVSGYTFAQWKVTAGSGTIGSSTSASTTFTPSASNTTVTAQYKRSYSVTKNSPSNGTITLSKTTVLAGDTFKVTLTPSSGYRVATFTVGGVDKKSSLNASNEYTHTASGTGTSFAVSATFEAIPGTTIYIKKTMPTFSYAHLYDPDNSDANLSDKRSWPGDKFTEWSTTTDGKYYYKTYSWNCSHFKMILNDNGSNQTGSGGAVTNKYETGKSWYIDTATNGTQVTLTEGVPTAKTITYTSTYSSAPDVTWGGTKPATAYPGETVSFTVAAKSGYSLTGVKYNDGSDHTLTPSSGTYSFTMPAGAVTVTANTVKQYTVTLTAGTGFATKKYKVGSGTQQTYSSAITVDSGSNVVFDVTYTTGYEYDSANSTLNGAVASNSNKTFTLSNVTADTTVILAAKKITWSGLTAVGKYTEDGTNYNGTFATNPVSIASTSATQLDGTTVTAPATVTVSNVKYNFVDFVATSGSVTTAATSGTNKTTTFKPTAANAVCTARYKKVYTITSSVDDTGTGAGTVSTNKTEVEAGGSYTITASAKSGSAVESVKVNGTAKTATASQTISSVSANQSVVAKFKSNIAIRGNSTIGTNWDPGDAMTSNAAGTEFTKTYSNVAGSSSGTSYEFKLHNGTSYSDDSSATVTITGGASTGTMTTKAAAGVNWKLTLKKAANVTIKSDGTKITEIKVVPADATKYAVTFKKAANTTITGSYEGINFSTASADATVQVYSGDEISFTVTAAEGKYISSLTGANFTPSYSATESDYKITNVTAAKTVTPTAASKLKITSTTNKTAWGTVSTSPEYARPGDTVTITYTAAAGTIKTLVAYDTTNQTVVKSWKRNGSGDLVVDQAQATQSSANLFSQVALTQISGSTYALPGKSGEALGAKDDSTAIGADDELTFTMPNGAVTVTSTYEEYVGTSEYYYNYYSNSGKGNSTQLSEGKINGNAYGYYNVTDRTEDDQLFTVSHRTEVTGTRYVYFTCPGSWTNLHVYFFDGVSWNWPGDTMSSYDSNGNYRYAIPSGAKKVIFNNGNDSYQTVNIDLTTTGGAYYVSGGETTTSAAVSEWKNPPSDAGIDGFTETEYFSTQDDKDIYPASYQAYTDAGLFNDHGISGNKRVAKPKGDTFGDNKTDYYILVFYPGVTYTINDKTFTPSGNPLVYWSTTLPGQTPEESQTVKVYAKDGTIRRDGDDPERNDRTYSYFEQYANTFVYSDSGYANHIGTRSSHDNQSSEGTTGYNGYTYDYVNKFNKGDKLYIKTVLKDDTFMNKYYLAAYCINGKTYELHTPEESDTGSVTEEFTVPEDWADKYVEITPIYFLRDTAGTKMITFYIEGYDEEVMNAGWGNTPFVYPFYQDANFNYVGNINNAFGGYPGQPMVFYKGNYYIQLPDKITTTISTGQSGTATIKGVTLGNGYWDDIHLITGEVSSHFQTYDYDDLYKIYNEKSNADHIICAFKYRTKKNNDEPASMSSATAANYNKTNGNGWEVLTNYYGEPVDVFGNVLTGSAKTLAEDIMAGRKSADTEAVVHAISQDYKSNSAGDYATEWVIYNTSGKKVVASSGGKTSIVPSALAINANTSGSGDLTDNFDKYDNATKAFKSIYTALYNDSNVLNKPAVVTYEKSIYGGGDKADRCDARWYFSQKDAPITATTRIEYTDDGKTWNTDTYTSGTGTGSTTGTKAYFTGKASTATDTPSVTTGIDGTNTTTYNGNVGQGYYTIKAENAGQYQFVGWYLLRDNYQNISTRSSYAADATEFPSHAEMSKNGDIFVARFKKTATGTFDIYHEIHPQTSGYGHVYVEAIVKDSGGTQQGSKIGSISGETLTDHVRIPTTYIRSGEGYTVEATFKATPYGTSNFEAFYATVSELLDGYTGYDFIKSINVNTSTNTATVIYDVDKLFTISGGSPVQTVTSVTHYSKFSLKTDLTYSLQYTFNTRYYGTKLFNYPNVKFTEQELRSYFLDQITDPNCNHIKLDKQFVKAKAPFESNFREDLTWVVDNVTFNNVNDPTIGYLTATQVSTKWATAMVYDFDNNGEMRTTTMVAPIEKLFNTSTNTKPTYQSTEDEATAISEWSVTNDQMYHPYRTSYTHDGTTTPLYIDHWDIYQLDSFTYKTVNNNPKMMDDGYNLDVDLSKSVLVAQAYSSRFNYVGYEDYVVVPVYNTVNVDRQGLSDSRKDSSATLLTITRNQWNANAAGNTDESKYKDSADRVYVDFMLNYNYSVEIDGKKTNILLNSTEDNIKVGFIVRSYTWENEQKQYGKAQYVLVDKDQINDKNRMEYCFGFNNSENNRKAGLYYEFKPFIVDTSNQAGSAGCNVTIDGSNYKALYEDSTVSVLDHVSFYQLGRL